MTKQPTLTKADLIEEVLRVTELPRKESETIVETIFESIIEALQKGDKIEIRGFGSFRTRQRRGRVGRNPKTGAKVEVPPKKIPFFKPSKELKDFVNTTNGDFRSLIRKPRRCRSEPISPLFPHRGPSRSPIHLRRREGPALSFSKSRAATPAAACAIRFDHFTLCCNRQVLLHLRSERRALDGLLWTPWRYQYMKEVESGKQPECIFCDAAARKDDAETLVVVSRRERRS